MPISDFCNKYINPCTNWKNDDFDRSVVSPHPHRHCVVSIFYCIGNGFYRIGNFFYGIGKGFYSCGECLHHTCIKPKI